MLINRTICAAGVALCVLSVPLAALEVISAKRVEKFTDPASDNDITPRAANEVVLVIDLGGIALDQFQGTAREDIVVIARAQQYQPSLVLGRDWFMVDGDNRPVGGVQEERRLVVVVPRDVLDFFLRFGKAATVAFKADAPITPVLP